MNNRARVRWHKARMASLIEKPLVNILFGARQTGKTFPLKRPIPSPSLWYNLADSEERNRLVRDPAAFSRECRALPPAGNPSTVVVNGAGGI